MWWRVTSKAIAALAVFSLAYSVLLMRRVLLGLVPIVLSLLLYTGWRALGAE